MRLIGECSHHCCKGMCKGKSLTILRLQKGSHRDVIALRVIPIQGKKTRHLYSDINWLLDVGCA